MDGESYYQVNNLSKRLNNKQFFSTLTSFAFAKGKANITQKSTLNP
jgi:hypothetical protein